MALFYSLGKLIFCLALTLQGVYILGFIPEQSNAELMNSMNKGLNNFQATFGIDKAIISEIEKQLPIIALVIGSLISLAAINIFTTSRIVMKLNIVGLVLLNCLVGIPYNVLRNQSNFFNPTDKSLFHLYSNLAFIGGLIYLHSISAPIRYRAKKA